MVVSGKPKNADHHRDTILNPMLIIEVLSPSSEGYDRGFKSAQYRTMASLQEYALVSQAEPRIEIFGGARKGTGFSRSRPDSLEAVSRMEIVGCTLALAAVFENVTFDDGDPGTPLPTC